MSQYVLSLDQGTTSSRAMLFDHEGKIAAWLSMSSPRTIQIQAGSSMTRSKFSPRSSPPLSRSLAQDGFARPRGIIAGVGITNQRETVIVWDRESGTAGLQRHCLAGPPHRWGSLPATCGGWRP